MHFHLGLLLKINHLLVLLIIKSKPSWSRKYPLISRNTCLTSFLFWIRLQIGIISSEITMGSLDFNSASKRIWTHCVAVCCGTYSCPWQILMLHILIPLWSLVSKWSEGIRGIQYKVYIIGNAILYLRNPLGNSIWKDRNIND